MPTTDEILRTLKGKEADIKKRDLRINAAALFEVARGENKELAELLEIKSDEDFKAAKKAGNILGRVALGIPYYGEKKRKRV